MTTALVAWWSGNPEDPLRYATCNADGYLKGGLGQYLQEVLNDQQKLDDFLEFADEEGAYDFLAISGQEKNQLDWELGFARPRPGFCTGLDEFKNEAGNYDYAYVWREDLQQWYVFSKKKEQFITLSYALTHAYLVK